MAAPARGEQGVAIIPARLGSTRFPGKVLARETGKFLIQHVWEAARRASTLSRVVIATDDARVVEAAASFGAESVLTSAEHPNGTSRLAEAARALLLADNQIVVNVQGDEPELEPAVIDAAFGALVGDARASIGTAATAFRGGEDPRDPNCVKVVTDLAGGAMYFSRSLIPMDRDAKGGAAAAPLRHIGIYCYRRRFLEEYMRLAPTPLEQVEQLEQLRALQHGKRVAVAVCASSRPGIDTPEQYQEFVRRWRARG